MVPSATLTVTLDTEVQVLNDDTWNPVLSLGQVDFLTGEGRIPEDFKVSIDWGDGSNRDTVGIIGNLALDIYGNGSGTIYGGHDYDKLTDGDDWPALFYNVTVTVQGAKSSDTNAGNLFEVVEGQHAKVQESYVSETTKGRSVKTPVVFTLDAPGTRPITLWYKTLDHTARANTGVQNDYIPKINSVTFVPGETKVSDFVYIRNDRLDDLDEGGNENFFIKVFKVAQCDLDIPSKDWPVGHVNITDIDSSVLRFTRDRYSAYENDGGVTTYVRMVPRSEKTVKVDIETTNSYSTPNATADVDYNDDSATLTFAPGEGIKPFFNAIYSDKVAEGTEFYAEVLSNPDNAGLHGTQYYAEIRIYDGTRPFFGFGLSPYGLGPYGPSGIIPGSFFVPFNWSSFLTVIPPNFGGPNGLGGSAWPGNAGGGTGNSSITSAILTALASATTPQQANAILNRWPDEIDWLAEFLNMTPEEVDGMLNPPLAISPATGTLTYVINEVICQPDGTCVLGILDAAGNEVLISPASPTYNSDTVDPPEVYAVIGPDSNGDYPMKVTAVLTFDGVAGDEVEFDLSEVDPDEDYVVIGVQSPDVPSESGFYDWTLDVEFYSDESAPTGETGQLKGTSPVVVRNDSPFGNGWGIEGLDEIVYDDKEGRVLLITGSGAGYVYHDEDGSGVFISPPTDPGVLTHNSNGTFTHVSPNQTTRHFDDQGRLIELSNRLDMSLTYIYDGDLLVNIVDPYDRVITFSYDGSNHLESIEQVGSRFTTFDIDAEGDVDSVTQTDGGTRYFEYDEQNRLVAEQWGTRLTTIAYDPTHGSVSSVDWGLDSVTTYDVALAPGLLLVDDNYNLKGTVTDPRGEVTEFAADELGRFVRLTSPDGGEQRWQWGDFGPLTYTDQLDRTTTFTYDTADLTLITFADVSTWEFEYESSFHQVTKSINSRGAETVFVIDPTNGNILSITDAENNTTTFVYDTYWDDKVIASIIDARKNAKTFHYDAKMRLEVIEAANGGQTTFVYDSAYNIRSITNADGRIVTYTFDGMRRLTKLERPGDVEIDYDYVNPFGIESIVDAEGKVTSFSYDVRGWLYKVADGVGTGLARETAYERDLAGNIISATNALDQVATYAYDSNGRLEAMITPYGINLLLEYDAADRLISFTDGNGNTTTYGYHEFRNWLTGTTDALGNETTFKYDTEGNLELMTDGAGSQTSYHYDKLSRPDQVVEAWGEDEARTTYMDYDAVGNLKQITDTFGTVTSYEYDSVNRLIRQVDADNDANVRRELVYSYSSAGEIRSATVKTATTTLTVTSYTYDPASRKSTETRAATTGIAQATITQFNKRGQPINVTDPFGVVTSYTYDALGRLKTLHEATNTSLNRTTTIGYDAIDRIVSTTDPLNVVTSFVYDDANRIIAQTMAVGTSVEQTYWFHLNAWGAVADQVDHRGVHTQFNYNELGQMIAITEAVGLAAFERTTSFSYDKVGRLEAVTDPFETVSRNSYDHLGRLITFTEAEGITNFERTTTYTYGTTVNTVKVTDPRTHNTTLNYDRLGRLSTITDADGKVMTYTYDALDRTIAVTDQRKNTTSYNYDALSRLTLITDALNQKTTFAYSTIGSSPYRQRITTTNARTYDTVTDLDELSRVQVIKDAKNGLSTFTYDALDRLISTADPLNLRTTYGYDALSRVTTITDARNKSTEIAFDDIAGTVTVTDPRSHATVYFTDALGRVNYVRDAVGNFTAYEYDTLDRLTGVINARGYRGTMSYDVLGRLTAQTDGLNHTTAFGYDLNDNVTSITDALGNITTTTFDKLNRPTKIQDPLNHIATYVYDEVGNVVNFIDANTNKTTLAYDELNRLFRRTDPETGVTTFVYDANNNLVNLIDPVGNKTTFMYDELDRRSKMTDPRGHSATYLYDAAGRLESETARDSRRIDYAYNENNQLVTEKWYSVSKSLVETLTFAYDDAGNQTLAANSAGAYTLVYDELNRPRTVQALFGLSLTFTYDEVGNRTLVEDSLGGAMASDYDAANRLIRREMSTSSTVRVVMDYAYTEADQLLSATRLDGKSAQIGRTTYMYDDAGRMTLLKHQDDSNSDFQTLTYTYDAANRVTALIRNSTTTSYNYDKTDQLTQDGAVTFGYDKAGNPSNFSIGAGNLLEATATGKYKNNYFAYEHDANGNRIERWYESDAEQVDPVTNYYAFDHGQRLVSYKSVPLSYGMGGEVPGDGIATLVDYTYDAYGNRVARLHRSDNATTITTVSYERFAIDQWEVQQDFWGNRLTPIGNEAANVWADLNALSSNALTYRRMYGPGWDRVEARLDASNNATWYLADRLGSVIGAVDADGDPIATITYEAFGKTKSGTLIDRYGYTGREYDSKLGLYHYRDRMYDPEVRRFLQQDQLGFAAGDYNLYRYVGNSPTNATDPSGLAIPDSPALQAARKQLEDALVELIVAIKDLSPDERKEVIKALIVQQYLELFGLTSTATPSGDEKLSRTSIGNFLAYAISNMNAAELKNLRKAAILRVRITTPNDQTCADSPGYFTLNPNWDDDSKGTIVLTIFRPGFLWGLYGRDESYLTSNTYGKSELVAILQNSFGDSWITRILNNLGNLFTVQVSRAFEASGLDDTELKLLIEEFAALNALGVNEVKNRVQEEVKNRAIQYGTGATVAAVSGLASRIKNVAQSVRNRRAFKFKNAGRIDGLREATHADIVRAFEGTGFTPSGHFIYRLKAPRLHDLGVRSFKDVETIIRQGCIVDADDGLKAIVHNGIAILFNPHTGNLVTIRPW